jgi:hypothetical protein
LIPSSEARIVMSPPLMRNIGGLDPLAGRDVQRPPAISAFFVGVDGVVPAQERERPAIDADRAVRVDGRRRGRRSAIAPP